MQMNSKTFLAVITATLTIFIASSALANSSADVETTLKNDIQVSGGGGGTGGAVYHSGNLNLNSPVATFDSHATSYGSAIPDTSAPNRQVQPQALGKSAKAVPASVILARFPEKDTMAAWKRFIEKRAAVAETAWYESSPEDDSIVAVKSAYTMGDLLDDVDYRPTIFGEQELPRTSYIYTVPGVRDQLSEVFRQEDLGDNNFMKVGLFSSASREGIADSPFLAKLNNVKAMESGANIVIPVIEWDGRELKYNANSFGGGMGGVLSGILGTSMGGFWPKVTGSTSQGSLGAKPFKIMLAIRVDNPEAFFLVAKKTFAKKSETTGTPPSRQKDDEIGKIYKHLEQCPDPCLNNAQLRYNVAKMEFEHGNFGRARDAAQIGVRDLDNGSEKNWDLRKKLCLLAADSWMKMAKKEKAIGRNIASYERQERYWRGEAMRTPVLDTQAKKKK